MWASIYLGYPGQVLACLAWVAFLIWVFKKGPGPEWLKFSVLLVLVFFSIPIVISGLLGPDRG